MFEEDYTKLKDLLDEESPDSKQLLDLITEAFQVMPSLLFGICSNYYCLNRINVLNGLKEFQGFIFCDLPKFVLVFSKVNNLKEEILARI